MLNAEGIDYTFRKQENKLTFAANGSEVIFRTMENPERLRGRTWRGLPLPKNVHAPFQAVLFFPSARVNTMPNSQDLGDMDFLDHVIKSGRDSRG